MTDEEQQQQPNKKPKIIGPQGDVLVQADFLRSIVPEIPKLTLFEAESKTKRYKMSIVAEGPQLRDEYMNQTLSVAYQVNTALHNIVDGKTYIVRENFDCPATPFSPKLLQILTQDVQSTKSRVMLQVTTKFNCKYRIDANLSVRFSEELIENSLDVTSRSILGKSFRKELQLIPDDESPDNAQKNHQEHVWIIKSGDDQEKQDLATSSGRKINFYCNDDTISTLVILCDIVITNHSSLNGLNLSTIKEGTSKKCLKDAIKGYKSMGVLLNDSLTKNSKSLDHLCDVEVVAKGKNFSCHKLLLTIASKVFANIFSYNKHNTEDTFVCGILSIADFDSETVDKMIQFIYKGEIPTGTTYASVRLLAIANKYEIVGLKLECESALIETIDIENAIQLWESSKLYHAQYLQGAVEEFMYENWDKGLQNTDAFQNLDPKPGMELLSSIIAIAKLSNEP